MINGLGVKIMKRMANWLFNWALKLPAWALCTVMTVSVVAILMAGLLGVLFILLSVTKKVIVISDFTTGVIFTLFSWVLLYFVLGIIDALFDRVRQTEIENSKKHKNKSKD